MRCGCRLNGKAAHVTDIRNVTVQFKRLDKLLSGFLAALDDECGHRTEALTSGVLLRPLMPRRRGQAGVLHFFDLRVPSEIRGDLCGVLVVTLHAKAERFETLKEEE